MPYLTLAIVPSKVFFVCSDAPPPALLPFLERSLEVLFSALALVPAVSNCSAAMQTGKRLFRCKYFRLGSQDVTLNVRTVKEGGKYGG